MITSLASIPAPPMSPPVAFIVPSSIVTLLPLLPTGPPIPAPLPPPSTVNLLALPIKDSNVSSALSANSIPALARPDFRVLSKLISMVTFAFLPILSATYFPSSFSSSPPLLLRSMLTLYKDKLTSSPSPISMLSVVVVALFSVIDMLYLPPEVIFTFPSSYV